MFDNKGRDGWFYDGELTNGLLCWNTCCVSVATCDIFDFTDGAETNDEFLGSSGNEFTVLPSDNSCFFKDLFCGRPQDFTADPTLNTSVKTC